MRVEKWDTKKVLGDTEHLEMKDENVLKKSTQYQHSLSGHNLQYGTT